MTWNEHIKECEQGFARMTLAATRLPIAFMACSLLLDFATILTDSFIPSAFSALAIFHAWKSNQMFLKHARDWLEARQLAYDYKVYFERFDRIFPPDNDNQKTP
jgi:hypothetical protein